LLYRLKQPESTQKPAAGKHISSEGASRIMSRRSFAWTVFATAPFIIPSTAWATQTHGGLEGLYVHQFAHMFFAFSMGLLIYWLNKWELVASSAWRSIQYAAVFFIAWNLDAFFSHWLVEQSGLITVNAIDGMRIQIETPRGSNWLAEVYYLTKLDHLLCVPALIFLFLGLKQLLKTELKTEEGRGVEQ
jgi:hypothetical protein